jgi:hypothetical protein
MMRSTVLNLPLQQGFPGLIFKPMFNALPDPGHGNGDIGDGSHHDFSVQVFLQMIGQVGFDWPVAKVNTNIFLSLLMIHFSKLGCPSQTFKALE